ncbi:hypothetical protein H5410_043341 [Solanum commersonii]|uniref:Uncharacterized protein n=1 Tax=Solanum commersonii TaxID=4109 RepID=A0A9J5XWX1_SOLCO|nr:hypothetical protein H5410_043341 [Solanum commersonii]
MADAMSRTSRSSFAHGRNSINGQINFTSITIIINYSPQQDQYIFVSSSSSSQRRNILISFIFPAMVELLQLMYQPSNTSPFGIHPINMHLSVTSFLIYCFAYDAQLKYISTTCSNYAKMVGDVFGPLTFASLSSVVYPPFSFIFYSFCILYSATQLLNRRLVKAQLYRLYHKFLNYLDKPTMTVTYQV